MFYGQSHILADPPYTQQNIDRHIVMTEGVCREWYVQIC